MTNPRFKFGDTSNLIFKDLADSDKIKITQGGSERLEINGDINKCVW